MTVLVTGAAGFIGFHMSLALVGRGEKVLGVDNLNEYYDVSLKQARLDVLGQDNGFQFQQLDIADRDAVEALIAENGGITRVVHLASQAGVRYSLIDPYAYSRANVEGQLVLLETCRKLERLDHFVYASSSSVYGGNAKLPFVVQATGSLGLLLGLGQGREQQRGEYGNNCNNHQKLNQRKTPGGHMLFFLCDKGCQNNSELLKIR